MVKSPFRVYFSNDEIETITEFLETDEGKKIPHTVLRKVVKYIVNRYIEEHS